MMDDKSHGVGSGGRSHLGEGSRIVGDLYFPGTVELPGYVKGRVDASTIVIETEGEVEGDLHAANVAIKGRFQGQITGGTVKLHSGAWVHGDITYENLSIENGAEVDGICKRQPFTKE